MGELRSTGYTAFSAYLPLPTYLLTYLPTYLLTWGGRAALDWLHRLSDGVLLTSYFLLLNPCSLLLAPYSLLLTPYSLLTY